MKRYLTFINEVFTGVSGNLVYQIGDQVSVVGVVDGRELGGENGTIRDICKTTITTNRNKDGECEKYEYRGQCYYINELDWWVSPFNLSKPKDFKIHQNESDPLGEEQWDVEEEVTEAVSSRAMEVLVSMRDDDKLTSLGDIWNSIDARGDEFKREYIVNLFNKAIGKKVHFGNFKDGKSLKKDRIIKGVYWTDREGVYRQNVINGYTFKLIGTKKDYTVNVYTPIGYWTSSNPEIIDQIRIIRDRLSKIEKMKTYNMSYNEESRLIDEERNLKYRLENILKSSLPKIKKPKEDKIVWFSHGKLEGEWE